MWMFPLLSVALVAAPEPTYLSCKGDGEDHARFADLFQAGLKTLGVDGLSYDPPNFRLNVDKGEAGHIELRNFYAEVCQAPVGERLEVLANRIRAATPLGKGALPDRVPWKEAKARLRLVVTPRIFFEALHLERQARGREGVASNAQVGRVVGEHFVAALAVDHPDRIEYASKRHLKDWKVSEAEAMKIAQANLTTSGRCESMGFAPDASGQWTDAPPGKGRLNVVKCDDGYTRSRLLMPRYLRSLGIKGAAVVMIPNASTLIVAGADDPDSVQGLLAVARQELQQPRVMSSLVLVEGPKGWERFVAPKGVSWEEELGVFERREMSETYAAQVTAMRPEGVVRKAGAPVLSPMELIEHEGKPRTTTAWVAGAGVQWLAKADLVVLLRPDPELALFTPFEALKKVLGARIKKVEGLYPERWEVAGFVTEGDLERLSKLPGTKRVK